MKANAIISLKAILKGCYPDVALIVLCNVHDVIACQSIRLVKMLEPVLQWAACLGMGVANCQDE